MKTTLLIHLLSWFFYFTFSSLLSLAGFSAFSQPKMERPKSLNLFSSHSLGVSFSVILSLR